MSSPQVLTLSNVEAVFDNTSTFFVRVAGRDDVDLFNVSAGTTLRVTPHVFKDNNQVRIKMLVNIEDGSLTGRTVDTLPVVNRSAISTQALIFEGESLLVGGIVREASNDDVTKVPVLGDIPWLGALFRSSSTGNARVERLFLIQPRLSAGRRAQPPGTGSPGGPAGTSQGVPVPVPMSMTRPAAAAAATATAAVAAPAPAPVPAPTPAQPQALLAAPAAGPRSETMP